tara:strand:- start:303 stop:911 length:609 start_codon:yes stop_codon:yes gene_type:complete
MIYNIYLNKNVKVFNLSIYILTGQIGAGKSEAQKIFQNFNYSCFCADNIVRDLYKKNNIIKNIQKIIPESVKDGEIDVNLLRKIIFTDYTVLNKVEDYIQPHVFKEFQKIEQLYNDKIIFTVPIIKNSEIFKKYKVIYIFSRKEIRRKRVESRSYYNKKMIDNIFEYQKTIDIYEKNSDFIIYNNSTLENLKREILTIINKI